MIDTIVIRIKNVSKYKWITEQYNNPQKRKGSITETFVSKETRELSERVLDHTLVYHDTNKHLLLNHRGNNIIPSSHYSLAYCLNNNKDYLEFNFSIPKYLYANNVMQFINMADQSASVQFLELIRFIHIFLRDNFIKAPIPEDVEINRIDLCYNQIFNTSEDALQYLDAQQLINRRLARASKNKGRTYDGESLMYNTRRYSFKVYHKGKEFAKHDAKQIAKNNKKNLPIRYLQEIADRTLRYEMTFRNSMLNYLTSHYFFVSGAKQLYAKYSEHPLSKWGRQLLTMFPAGQNKIERKLYEKFIKRSKSFTLKSEFDIFKDPYDLAEAENVTFDKTIFEILVNTFFKKVNEYQMDKCLNISSIADKIDEYNENNALKNKLRRTPVSGKSNTRILVTALLAQNMDLEALKPYIPERSFSRMKQDLKLIGITTTDHQLSIPKPRTDYLDYKIYMNKLHFSEFLI